MSTRQMASMYSARPSYSGGGDSLLDSIMKLVNPTKGGPSFGPDGSVTFSPFTGFNASALNAQMAPFVFAQQNVLKQQEMIGNQELARLDKQAGYNKDADERKAKNDAEASRLKAELEGKHAELQDLIKQASAAGLDVKAYQTTANARLSNFNKKLQGDSEALDRGNKLAATKGEIIQAGYQNNPTVKNSVLGGEIGTNYNPLGVLFHNTMMQAQPGAATFNPGSLFGGQDVSVFGSYDNQIKDPKTGLPMKQTIPASATIKPKPVTPEEIAALGDDPTVTPTNPFAGIDMSQYQLNTDEGPKFKSPASQATPVDAIMELLNRGMEQFGTMNQKYPPYRQGF